jgi:hypothetical protein
MPPSDSCLGPPAVMHSRRWSPGTRPSPGPPRQVSQVPVGSVHARRPHPPRRAQPLLALVASRSASGFTTFGRLAALAFVTRPNRVHACALRLTWPSSQASYGRSPHHTPGRLHGARASTMTSTFQLAKPNKLHLTHRKREGAKGRNGNRRPRNETPFRGFALSRSRRNPRRRAQERRQAPWRRRFSHCQNNAGGADCQSAWFEAGSATCPTALPALV